MIGHEGGDYELSALGVRAEGGRLDDTVAATVDPGERHEYVATLPRSGTGTLEPVDGCCSRESLALVGTGALVAGALGVSAVRRIGRRRGR